MHINYASGITLLSTTFYKLCSTPLNSYIIFFFSIKTNNGKKKSLIRILPQNSGLKALSLFIYSLGGVYIDLEGFKSSLTKRFSKQAVSKTCFILPQEKHEKKTSTYCNRTRTCIFKPNYLYQYCVVTNRWT